MTVARVTRIQQAVDRYVESALPDIVSDMRRILQFNTVSGGRSEEERQVCAKGIRDGFAWLGERSRALGLQFRNLEDIVCVAEQPGAETVLGALLHLDVVPPGENWTRPPFGGEMVNDVIYGRGCQDDKGPIVQCLHALAAAKSLELPFRRSVRLIIGSLEETGVWSDIDYYLEREAAPDLCFVPDAEFPIVNGEKGFVDLAFEAAAGGDDPGDLQILSVAAGERSNIVPSRCRVALRAENGSALEDIRRPLAVFLENHPDARAEAEPGTHEGAPAILLTFTGSSAHGSRPERGKNAARDAASFLASLPHLHGPRADFIRLIAECARGDNGEGLGIEYIHPFIGPTTQNLGILDINPDRCRAVFNVRQTAGQSVQTIIDAARAKARDAARPGDAPVSVACVNRTHEALFVSPDDHPEFFAALQTAYQTVTGREATLKAMGGTTFAKAFPNAMCFGPLDPAEEGDYMHQADERISIDHLIRNVKIYALAISLLALDV